MPVGAITLTPAGLAKIKAAVDAAAQAAQIGVARTVIALRSEVAARAPSSEEEARLLSRGTATSFGPGFGMGSGIVGTPEEGRFIRQGEMVSLREAITSEPISTIRRLDRILGGIGSASYLNARTGFFWRTRRRGIQGPTLPFNRAYVQALENGGAIWTVIPRPDNRTRVLEPEPGVIASVMVKVLPPRRMFRGALTARGAGIKQELGASIRQAFRERTV